MRAKEFVEATAVKYGFSSKILAELGGGEKQRVLEFAAGCGGPLPQYHNARTSFALFMLAQ
jgi:hypothetical protein